jgi:hypothetical protein
MITQQPDPFAVFSRTRSQTLVSLGLLHEWQMQHPDIADYRVADAFQGLTLAIKALSHLDANAHYPEWHAAMAEFRKTLDADYAEPKEGHRDE